MNAEVDHPIEGNDDDEDIDHSDDELMEAEEEDLNSKEPQFKQWLGWTHSHTSLFKCLLKLADKIDKTADNDDDGEFEDIDIDDEDDDISNVVSSETVVNIDELKMAALGLINMSLVL